MCGSSGGGLYDGWEWWVCDGQIAIIDDYDDNRDGVNTPPPLYDRWLNSGMPNMRRN
jgi:hypothetical protein